MDEIKRIAIERWLHKAGNDLRTAETMLTVQPPTTDTICFHAQQCMEKSLKAYLVHLDQHVEKTHYLPRLVELCARTDVEFRSLMESARQLTDYAVSDRYPDNWREIPRDEASDAVKKAAEVFRLVKQKLAQTL
jgi:HEPN domain-containing protein